VKIGCLPAVIVPWKLNEIMNKWGKRILIDACGVKCGARLIEREGMPVDRYIELTSTLGIRKAKRLPSKDLDDKVYRTIQKELDSLLGKNISEKERVETELLVAFGTDDGENLNNDHVGMAKYFHIYRFSDGKEELIEKRKNVEFTVDESIKHGDPEKAKATSSALQGVDVLVGRKFGPNITRLLKKFVCIVVRTDSIASAIKAVYNNMDSIVEQKNRGEERKHIALTP
jgi:predicted Fe-Mo cluster-binding NifX family protein